jgi:hypothetical protein
MHVETMARNESLHKQLETKEASIAILKKSKKKMLRHLTKEVHLLTNALILLTPNGESLVSIILLHSA